MSLTPSTMLPLGTKAPTFSLLDTVSNTIKNLEQLRGEKGTVIAFICNHCPYVVHVNPQMAKMAKDFMEKGVRFIAISSNDVTNYPEDAPHLMKVMANQEGYPFPYLYDETQQVAKAYYAACTPDFYLFDGNMELVYRGQFDNSRPGNGTPVTGSDLKSAMNSLLDGSEIDENQKPSMGCNIKWVAP